MANGKVATILVKVKKVTKNMVMYTPVNGKGQEEMVDPYFNQELLLKAFEKLPKGLRITLEELEVVE